MGIALCTAFLFQVCFLFSCRFRNFTSYILPPISQTAAAHGEWFPSPRSMQSAHSPGSRNVPRHEKELVFSRAARRRSRPLREILRTGKKLRRDIRRKSRVLSILHRANRDCAYIRRDPPFYRRIRPATQLKQRGGAHEPEDAPAPHTAAYKALKSAALGPTAI